MTSLRFTSLTSRLVGRMFSLGVATSLIALSSLAGAQESTLASQDSEPDWSSWKGIPMEPIFAWNLYIRPAIASAEAKAPVLGESGLDEQPIAQTQDEVLAEASGESEAASLPPTEGTDASATAQPEAPDGNTTSASAPVKAPTPWDALDLGLFRRATAPVPAGIPVVRATERIAEAEAARGELAAALVGDQGTLWLDYLRSELQFGQSEPKRWASMARLVVSLELFEFAPLVVAGLDQPATTYVHQAAWSALSELFGVRWETVQEWQTFIGDSTTSPYTPAGHAKLRELADVSRAHQLELFSFRLDEAVTHLVDVDPRVRAGCARVLGEALLAGTVDREATLGALLSRLETEHQPEAVDAILEAAFTVLEGRGTEDPSVERMRSILAQSARSTAPRAELLIARGLARLPWTSAEPHAPDSLETGAGLLTQILRDLGEVGDSAAIAADEHGRDADVLLGVLKALDRICRGVGDDSETSRRLSANADRSPLLQIVLGADFDLGVREIAAGTLPRVAPPEDVAVLIDVLCGDGANLTSELRFALLGAMGRFVERDDAAPEYTAPVVSCLLDHTGRSEEHMRERALGLLLSESVTAEISSQQVLLFLARLDVEQSESLQDTLLLLIERYGDKSMLDNVLQLKSFDALVARGPASEKTMLDLVSKLAGLDPAARVAAAKRLYPAVDPGSQITRGMRAVSLVAELSTESLVDLPLLDHREIARWAVELRVYGVKLAKDIPGGMDFLQRLVDLHVPNSGTGESYSQAEKDLMQALFLSDIAEAKGNGEAKAMESEVLAKFATALEQAPQHQLQNFAMVVRRARARFREQSGSLGQSFSDYSIVFNSPERHLLEPSDLRIAASSALAQARVRAETAALAAGTSPDAIPDQSKVPTAGDQLTSFRFSLALVSHASWHREPEPVRLSDLGNLATAAAASGDLEAVTTAHGMLADLPAYEGPGYAGTVPPPVRPWTGLASGTERLAELNRLLTVIQFELARLTVQNKSPEDVDLALDPGADEKGLGEDSQDQDGNDGDSKEGTPEVEDGGATNISPVVKGSIGFDR